MDLEQRLSSIRRTTLTVYAALFPSLAIYVVLAFAIGRPSGEADAATLGGIKLVMTLAALAIGGASVLVPRWMLADQTLAALAKATPDLQRLARGRNGVLDPEQLRALQALDPSQVVLIAIAQRWTTTVILGVALGEAVAICGLMLALLSHDPMQIVPFAAAAVVLMMSHFPQLDRVLDRVKTLRGY
jgi:hypothetical protein